MSDSQEEHHFKVDLTPASKGGKTMEEFLNSSYEEIGERPQLEHDGSHGKAGAAADERDRWGNLPSEASPASSLQNADKSSEYRKYGHMAHIAHSSTPHPVSMSAQDFIKASSSSEKAAEAVASAEGAESVTPKNVGGGAASDGDAAHVAEGAGAVAIATGAQAQDVAQLKEAEASCAVTPSVAKSERAAAASASSTNTAAGEASKINAAAVAAAVYVNDATAEKAAAAATAVAATSPKKKPSKWGVIRQMAGVETLSPAAIRDQEGSATTATSLPELTIVREKPLPSAAPRPAPLEQPVVSAPLLAAAVHAPAPAAQTDSDAAAEAAAEAEADAELPHLAVSYFNTDSTVEEIFSAAEDTRVAYLQELFDGRQVLDTVGIPPAALSVREPSLRATSFQSPLKGLGSSIEAILAEAAANSPSPLKSLSFSRNSSARSDAGGGSPRSRPGSPSRLAQDSSLASLCKEQAEKISMLELSNVTLAEETAKSKAERDDQAALAANLLAEAQKLRAVQVNSEKEAGRHMQTTAQQAQQELDAVRHTLDDAQFEARTAGEHAARLATENAAIRAELRNVKVELSSLNYDFSEVKVSHAAAEEESATLRDQVAVLVGTQREALAAATKAAIDVHVGESKVSALEAEKRQLESRVHVLVDEANNLKQLLNASSAAHEKRQEEFAILDQRYSALELEYSKSSRASRRDVEALMRERQLGEGQRAPSPQRSRQGSGSSAFGGSSGEPRSVTMEELQKQGNVVSIQTIPDNVRSLSVPTPAAAAPSLAPAPASAPVPASVLEKLEEDNSYITHTPTNIKTRNHRISGGGGTSSAVGESLNGGYVSVDMRGPNDFNAYTSDKSQIQQDPKSSAVLSGKTQRAVQHQHHSNTHIFGTPQAGPATAHAHTSPQAANVAQQQSQQSQQTPIAPRRRVPTEQYNPPVPPQPAAPVLQSSAQAQAQAQEQQVDLRRWREEGYPSEYAYAQATDSLRPQKHVIKPPQRQEQKQQQSYQRPPPYSAAAAAASQLATSQSNNVLLPPPVPAPAAPVQVQQQHVSHMAAGAPARSNSPAMMHHRGRVSGSNIATSSSAEKMGAVASASPWATSASSSELSARFDAIDKNLTVLITERTNLVDESSRLHQRGGKTLRERSRLAAVELRLSELEREISTDRKQLAARPQ